MTCGWSISYTVVPAAQGSRYARASRPEARMTTCRTPASAACGEERVDVAGARGQHVGHALHAPRGTGDVDVNRVEFTAGPAGEEVDADGAHQWLGKPVFDQRVIGPGGPGSSRGHHGRRGPHTGRQVPAIVLGARHGRPFSGLLVSQNNY